MAKRIHYIDIVSGIGILLVLVGHIPSLPVFIRDTIYSFHMPTFFFLSGFLKSSKKISTRRVFKKKLKTLIRPYFFFGIVSIFLVFFLKVVSSNPIELRHFKDALRIFYLKGNPLPYNKVIWFLVVLFWTNLVFNIIPSRLIKLTTISSLVIALFLSDFLIFNNFRLPFGLDILPFALFFYSSGFLFKNTLITYDIDLKKINGFTLKTFLLISFCGLILMNLYLSPEVNLMSLLYSDPITSSITFLLGTCLIFCIALLISENKYIEYIGENSLIVLGFHYHQLLLFVQLGNSS